MKKLVMWVGLIIFFAVALPVFGQQTAEEYFNKGTELYEANDYPAAVAAFGKALELKPDYLDAEYNLAITYWTQKDYPKAISTLESLVEKAPDTDIGKRSAADLKKLKEPIISVVVPTTTEETEETGKKVDVALKSVPELTADLKFGLLAKRFTATDQLRMAETDEAIKALIESTFNEYEKMVVRSSAVQNLARIKNPKALSIVDQALTGTSFPLEEKFKFLRTLANQNTPEAFKVILKFWFLGKWPKKLEESSTEITRKEWPPELADPRMWTLTKTLGKEESLPFFGYGWPGIIETTDTLIPGSQRDYIFYYNLMAGFLKGDFGVPVLAQRLKEDYPINSPVSPQPAPGGSPSPGFTPRPILKQPTSQETQNWTVEEEIKLRVEMVEVLGDVAGESQGPFLKYLALNDPKTEVNNAASEAFKSLNIRIAQSTENYNKGLKLLESGNLDGAISLLEQALKENPDAPYRKNITKTLVTNGLQFLAQGNKERATPLLRPLYLLLWKALARTIDEKILGLPEPPEGEGTGGMVPTADIVQKMINDQLAVLEIPPASIKAQDIQNIYDFGLELGIIKKPPLVPVLEEMEAPPKK